VDTSIGKMVAALKSTGSYNSTLIVITAKHGQSPVLSLLGHIERTQ
jgi:arylsulfatase A-like enzyme